MPLLIRRDMIIYIIAWFPMLLLAILNGAARDALYKNKLGELRAHQVSTFTGMILFFLYGLILNLFKQFESLSQAFLVGFIWVIMTVIFEFGFFHFVMKHPWEELLADYNIFRGRLWGVFLLFLLFLPILIYCIFQ